MNIEHNIRSDENDRSCEYYRGPVKQPLCGRTSGGRRALGRDSSRFSTGESSFSCSSDGLSEATEADLRHKERSGSRTGSTEGVNGFVQYIIITNIFSTLEH